MRGTFVVLTISMPLGRGVFGLSTTGNLCSIVPVYESVSAPSGERVEGGREGGKREEGEREGGREGGKRKEGEREGRREGGREGGREEGGTKGGKGWMEGGREGGRGKERGRECVSPTLSYSVYKNAVGRCFLVVFVRACAC